MIQHSSVRYVLAGFSAFVLEYVLFIGLFALTQQLYVSNSISFIVGVVAGFAFHKSWSFAGEHRMPIQRQVWLYIAIALINLVFTNVVIGLCVQQFHVPAIVGKFIALVFIVVWNYILFNGVIFRLEKSADDDKL